MPNVGEDLEQTELSNTLGQSVTQDNYFGKKKRFVIAYKTKHALTYHQQFYSNIFTREK